MEDQHCDAGHVSIPWRAHRAQVREAGRHTVGLKVLVRLSLRCSGAVPDMDRRFVLKALYHLNICIAGFSLANELNRAIWISQSCGPAVVVSPKIPRVCSGSSSHIRGS